MSAPTMRPGNWRPIDSAPQTTMRVYRWIDDFADWTPLPPPPATSACLNETPDRTPAEVIAEKALREIAWSNGTPSGISGIAWRALQEMAEIRNGGAR